MAGESATDFHVYRAGKHLLVIIGVFASLFAAMGLAGAVKSGEWSFVVVVVGAAGVLVGLLQTMRLEVRPEGFKYRNLTGTREIMFADISRASIEVVRSGHTPQGVAWFWVQRQGGERVKVNLRLFPVRAAAVLFTSLEMSGVQIETPDSWTARQFADRVRAEQAKMLIE